VRDGGESGRQIGARYDRRSCPPERGFGRGPAGIVCPRHIVLELVCFIPAVVLVWLRPLTTRTTKWIATAILVGIPVIATALDYGFYPRR